MTCFKTADCVLALGFVHRDLKAASVHVSETGRLKIMDFDVVKICVSHHVKHRLMTVFFNRTSEEFVEYESVGTLCYQAPECLTKGKFGRAIDWWAYGKLVE